MNVVVVGAGIVGAACADSLSEAGCHVTLIDARSPGSGTTAAGMGHIVVMDDSAPQFALTRLSAQLWSGLAPQLPAPCEFEPCGTIWVAADDEEMAAVHAKFAFYSARGVAVETLDPKRLAELEPHLRPGLAGGLLVPGDAVLYPPGAARFLVDRAAGRGAVLRFGRAVERIEGRSVVLSGGERIGGDAVVNAAGFAAPTLTPGLSIRPRKGHLIITERYPGFVRHQLVELGYLKSAHSVSADSVAFNIQPRATGQALIGSSRQYGDESTAVQPAILRRMIDRATSYMPGLARLTATRVWTGFRPATPDKLPLIGPMPGQDGLWIAAGHEGLGITTALGTAKVLTEQMLRWPASIPFDPYLPGRITSGGAHA
jgi:glycine/D-amino acid oxidase-like deaminating enzyme